MSASHRALSRLPLTIFEDLVVAPEAQGGGGISGLGGGPSPLSPSELRSMLCQKLLRLRTRARRGGSNGGPPSGRGGGGGGGGVATVGQLLELSPPALLGAVDPLLTHAGCIKLVERICALCGPRPTTALELLRRSRGDGGLAYCLRTGVGPLDRCLRGGIRVGTVTEVVGRAGTGKTQLALLLCVLTAAGGRGTAYVDAERKLSLGRLREMAAERRASSTGGGDDGRPNYRDPLTVLENVTVHSPSSTAELMAVVNGLEEEIVVRNEQAAQEGEEDGGRGLPVGLIVLDSIAAPTRRDFAGGGDSAPRRVETIFQIAQSLKRLADQLQVAVVVINQVGGGMDNAALGVSWHHCVSTRVVLEYEQDPHRIEMGLGELEDGGGGGSGRTQVRTATVVKSNVAPFGSMMFKIDAAGLSSLSDGTE